MQTFPASFVLVIAVCVVQWAEFSLRDTGFYDPSVLHGKLHHLFKKQGGECEGGMEGGLANVTLE